MLKYKHQPEKKELIDMKREDYYRPNDESREDYHRNQSRTADRGPAYNNYNNYGNAQPQQPYYPPRRHHHVFLWIVVIILCLGLGWFAADHFMGGDSSQANNPSTTVNKTSTVNNKTTNNKQPQQQAPQQPNVGKLQREMSKLDVDTKDQTTAVNFYEKQNPKNQEKMNKMIDLVNKVVPSNAMKRQVLNWILHD